MLQQRGREGRQCNVHYTHYQFSHLVWWWWYRRALLIVNHFVHAKQRHQPTIERDNTLQGDLFNNPILILASYSVGCSDGLLDDLFCSLLSTKLMAYQTVAIIYNSFHGGDTKFIISQYSLFCQLNEVRAGAKIVRVNSSYIEMGISELRSVREAFYMYECLVVLMRSKMTEKRSSPCYLVHLSVFHISFVRSDSFPLHTIYILLSLL